MTDKQNTGIDTRSAAFVAELARVNEVFTGQTGDSIMDTLWAEDLHRCPGCDYLGSCRAQCHERSPLTVHERARIDALRIDAMLSA
ncbi:MAG: hypothetical protein Q8P83_00195 [bacterium]|nr:hypothetical protein [bacterium]